jgi:hypothetical protein
MRVTRRHVFHSTVSILILVQLGFAGAFLYDAHQTNRTYDLLADHRVLVKGLNRGCFEIGGGQRGPLARVCHVTYNYQGTQFSLIMPPKQSTDAYVDPQDPSIRMTKVSFDGGPERTTVDLVLALLLMVGAITMATAHLAHLRRRRSRMNRGGVSSGHDQSRYPSTGKFRERSR